MNFNEMMATLARLGVWEILLPFLLIFTVVYAVLITSMKTLFGKTPKTNDAEEKDNTKFAIVISFVIALGVVIPHSIGAYPPNMNVVLIINAALPQVALIAVAVIGVMILLGLFGIDTYSFANKGISIFIIALSIGVVTFIFGRAAGWWVRIPRFLSFLNDPDTQVLLVTILVFGLVVWFITGPRKKPKKFDEHLKGINKALFSPFSNNKNNPGD